MDLQEKLVEYDALIEPFLSFSEGRNRVLLNAEDYICLYVYHTTAIEGNALTFAEVVNLLKYDQVAAGKSMRDHQEVLDLRKAYESMINNVRTGVPISENVLLDYHKLILRGTNPLMAGSLKKGDNYTMVAVGVIKHYPSWRLAGALLSNAITHLLTQQKEGVHPLIMASELHFNLAAAHPFADGNGRLVRLVFEHIAEQYKIPTLLFKKEDKKQYIDSLQQADEQKNPSVFTSFVVENSIQFMKEIIETRTSEKKRGFKL